jgi:hypothetical protein
MGIAALVVGIAALLFSILFFPLGLLLGVVGIALAIAARRRAQRGQATNGGLAIAGLVLSVLALLISIAILFFFANVFNKTKDCADEPKSQQRACIKDKLDQ